MVLNFPYHTSQKKNYHFSITKIFRAKTIDILSKLNPDLLKTLLEKDPNIPIIAVRRPVFFSGNRNVIPDPVAMIRSLPTRQDESVKDESVKDEEQDQQEETEWDDMPPIRGREMVMIYDVCIFNSLAEPFPHALLSTSILPGSLQVSAPLELEECQMFQTPYGQLGSNMRNICGPR